MNTDRVDALREARERLWDTALAADAIRQFEGFLDELIAEELDGQVA